MNPSYRKRRSRRRSKAASTVSWHHGDVIVPIASVLTQSIQAILAASIRGCSTQNPNAVWMYSALVYNRAIQAFVPALRQQEGI
jgi:hypothetical protein